MHKFIEKQKSTILQFRKQISTFGWEVKKKWPENQQRRKNIPGGFLKISKNVNLSAKSIWVRFEWKTMVEWLKLSNGATDSSKNLQIITQSFRQGWFNKALLQRQSMTYFLVQVLNLSYRARRAKRNTGRDSTREALLDKFDSTTILMKPLPITTLLIRWINVHYIFVFIYSCK